MQKLLPTTSKYNVTFFYKYTLMVNIHERLSRTCLKLTANTQVRCTHLSAAVHINKPLNTS